MNIEIIIIGVGYFAILATAFIKYRKNEKKEDSFEEFVINKSIADNFRL